MRDDYMSDKCYLCPRNCGVDRKTQRGYCKSGEQIRLSRVGLHMWEEPCISHKNGSGTVFFAGCNMGCVYCQNHEISHGLHGVDVDEETLCRELLHLQDIGAENINFVTPTHYSDKIIKVLDRVKHKLDIPVVYNTSGYEKTETLKALSGYIDIYLPDVKYYSPEIGGKYSACSNYFETALSAVEEMLRQTGKIKLRDDGKMLSGTLIRHLVLPKMYKDSIRIFDELEKNIDITKAAVSIMCQYFPSYKAQNYPEINRKTTTLEYMKVVEKVRSMDFALGFIQDKASAKQEYVPEFDY